MKNEELESLLRKYPKAKKGKNTIQFFFWDLSAVGLLVISVLLSIAVSIIVVWLCLMITSIFYLSDVVGNANRDTTLADKHIAANTMITDIIKNTSLFPNGWIAAQHSIGFTAEHRGWPISRRIQNSPRFVALNYRDNGSYIGDTGMDIKIVCGSTKTKYGNEITKVRMNCDGIGFGTTNITSDYTFNGTASFTQLKVSGVSQFNKNVTFDDSITVTNSINILNSQIQMGGHTVLEDNFVLTGLGFFGGAKPLRFGNTNFHDVFLFATKKLFLWETPPAGFPNVAFPLGGSAGISMSLGTGGLLVNNAVSGGGSLVPSTMQIKENIVDYPGDEARTKLMAFRVRKYTHKKWWLDYIQKRNVTKGGFIAEEVRDVDSSFVSEIPTSNENLINGTLVVLRKEDFHHIAIKNLQMLVNENIVLQRNVSDLQSTVNSLEMSNYNLYSMIVDLNTKYTQLMNFVTQLNTTTN